MKAQKSVGDDSESSGDATGSTDYEVIQAADPSEDMVQDHLKLLKSESGNTSNRQHGESNKKSISDLCKTMSEEHFTQMKNCDLKAKALLGALHSELKGLSRAFHDRYRLI